MYSNDPIIKLTSFNNYVGDIPDIITYQGGPPKSDFDVSIVISSSRRVRPCTNRNQQKLINYQSHFS